METKSQIYDTYSRGQEDDSGLFSHLTNLSKYTTKIQIFDLSQELSGGSETTEKKKKKNGERGEGDGELFLLIYHTCYTFPKYL